MTTYEIIQEKPDGFWFNFGTLILLVIVIVLAFVAVVVFAIVAGLGYICWKIYKAISVRISSIRKFYQYFSALKRAYRNDPGLLS